MTTHPTTPRALLDSAISEKAFQAQVIQLAALHGWLCYHTFDSRRSAAGFPDLVLVRDGRVIFAELKTERGKVSAHQRQWIDALLTTTRATWLYGAPDGVVSVYVWRPSQWNAIEATLATRRKGAA